MIAIISIIFILAIGFIIYIIYAADKNPKNNMTIQTTETKNELKINYSFVKFILTCTTIIEWLLPISIVGSLIMCAKGNYEWYVFFEVIITVILSELFITAGKVFLKNQYNKNNR